MLYQCNVLHNSFYMEDFIDLVEDFIDLVEDFIDLGL